MAFSKEILSRSGLIATPIGAYTYDATIIALDYLCRGVNIRSYKKYSSSLLLQRFSGIAPSGNLLSPVYLHKD